MKKPAPEVSDSQLGVPRAVQKKAESKMSDAELKSKGKMIKDEGMVAGKVKFETYIKWFKSGSMGLMIFTLIILLVSQGVQQYQTIMITHWT